MSDEYRCKCHGLTVKDINDELRWDSEIDDRELAKGLPIVYIVCTALVFGMYFLGWLG
jgi:hypothetical protein